MKGRSGMIPPHIFSTDFLYDVRKFVKGLSVPGDFWTYKVKKLR